MSCGSNIRVRDMLKPPTPMRPMWGADAGVTQPQNLADSGARRHVNYESAPTAAAGPPPPETEGVLIAGQLRAAAAAVAPMLAWICLVLALALFHKDVWTAINVVLVLVGHAYLATVGGLWGETTRSTRT